MKLDFEYFFAQYESLQSQVDDIFAKVSSEYSQQVVCAKGCSECCHALFDIPLIEALYLNNVFLKLPELQRNEILAFADQVDRKAYKLKRFLYKESEKGVGEEKIVEQVAKERLRCPLLNSEGICSLYKARPITCRLYGIPVAIAGQGKTCSLTGFVSGEKYPTVNLDIIHIKLRDLSIELVTSIKSKFVQDFGQMLVPVSTAILTEFTSEYLGVPKHELEEFLVEDKKEPAVWTVGDIKG